MYTNGISHDFLLTLQILSKSVLSLKKELRVSSMKDERAEDRLDRLCSSSPLRTREDALMMELKDVDARIESERREQTKYDVPESLTRSLNEARGKLERKTNLVQPVKKASAVVQAQRDKYQSTLSSLNRKWDDFKRKFESGMKGNAWDDQSAFLQLEERGHRRKGKSMRASRRKVKNSLNGANDVYVAMLANIGALRDAVHKAAEDASMDAAGVRETVHDLLSNGDEEITEAKTAVQQLENEVQDLKNMKAQIMESDSGLQGNRTAVEKELEDVRGKMKEEPCSLYMSEFSRRRDHREKLAQAIESLAEKIGLDVRCCGCDDQCEDGTSRCAGCE